MSAGERAAPRRLLKISMLPALATLGNAISGFAAIHVAARTHSFGFEGGWQNLFPSSNIALACYLIVLAGIFDMLDGSLARLTRTTSDFGGQLDSLADVVSFGLAPAFIVVRMVMNASGVAPMEPLNPNEPGPLAWTVFGRVVWCAAALYFACAAIRLARFNIENDECEEAHQFFSGLPSPAAAAGVITLVILHEELLRAHYQGIADVLLYFIPFCTAVFGGLMVSRIRFVHVSNAILRGKRPFHWLGYLGAGVVLFWIYPYVALVIFVLVYITSPLLRHWWLKALGKPDEKWIFDPKTHLQTVKQPLQIVEGEVLNESSDDLIQQKNAG